MFEWLKKAFGSKTTSGTSSGQHRAAVVAGNTVPSAGEPSQKERASVVAPDQEVFQPQADSTPVAHPGQPQGEKGGLDTPHGRHRREDTTQMASTEDAAIDSGNRGEVGTGDNQASTGGTEVSQPNASSPTVVNLSEEMEWEKNSVPRDENKEQEEQLIEELTREAENYVEKE